ncbi:MAG: hypothetical protein QXS20_05380, partial [Candidatus Thorarchaeota archaeon]
LLRYIFFTEMQVEQAAKILNTIMERDGVMPDTDWERLMLSSRGLYVKVMKKLRDAGLVEKRSGEFRLSRDFAYALGKMAQYWTEIVDSFGAGDRSVKF